MIALPFKRSVALLALVMTLGGLSGCAWWDRASETGDVVSTEVGEAVDNVTTTILNTKEWVDTKIEQTQDAATDIQEAAESISEALDSVQELTGGNGEEEESAPSDESSDPDEETNSGESDPE